MRRRRNFTEEQKVGILRRHLIDHVPVSDLCDDLGLQPTVFYRWQKLFRDNGAAAFERESNGQKRKQDRRIKALEEKIKKKGEVLAKFMEEHVTLKKVLGRSEGSLGTSRCPG